MSATEDAAQMLTLVPWLLERPGASVAEISRTFGIPESKTRQHLYHLDFCGLPGLGGGDLFDVSIVGDRVVVSMADELRAPLRLTPREALTLVLTGEAVAQALGGDLPALRSALDRIRDAVGIPPAVQIHLEEDGTHWLAPLRDAIADRHRVRLRYQGRGDLVSRERSVDPLRLHVSQGWWYVQGHDHDAGELRTFRLDRIVDLDVTDEPCRVGPPEGDLPPPRYEPGPGDQLVELVLGPPARWVAEAVEPDELENLDDGRLRVVFHTDALPWARRLCLVGGPGVEVVRPAELATEVRREAAVAAARYEGSDA